MTIIDYLIIIYIVFFIVFLIYINYEKTKKINKRLNFDGWFQNGETWSQFRIENGNIKKLVKNK
jgi:hypothetical protein